MSTADVELSLLPLKPGDHLWRQLPSGGSWHALYVGQFLQAPNEDGDGVALALPSEEGARCLPQSVMAVVTPTNASSSSSSSSSFVARLPLAEFVGTATEHLGGNGGADATSLRPTAEGTVVRLYTRRPRGRQAAVARALGVSGARVDTAAVTGFPELLAWWAIFDEEETFQPGLCATRARAVRYRLVPRGDLPAQFAVTSAVLAGGQVVRRGRVVLRGVRLMKALRLTSAAGAGWSSLGGFVGQAIAANILDDGDTGTAVATAAGGWAGGLAGSGVAAMAASSVGVEALGAGYLTGGLVVCGSLSAAGAVAGAGLAYAAKKALDQQPAGSGTNRSAEYHDCPLRLIGGSGDVFELFDATFEVPPEDANDGCVAGSNDATAGGVVACVAASSDADAEEKALAGEEEEGEERKAPAGEVVSTEGLVTAVGWYAVRVSPEDLQRLRD